jgi:hypothetical protein
MQLIFGAELRSPAKELNFSKLGRTFFNKSIAGCG